MAFEIYVAYTYTTFNSLGVGNSQVIMKGEPRELSWQDVMDAQKAVLLQCREKNPAAETAIITFWKILRQP